MRRPIPGTFENCEHRATARYALSSHVKAKHGPERSRDFQCQLFSSKFYTSHYLKVHIVKLHVKEVIYRCDLCKFSSPYMFSLTFHVRARHEKSKTFKCSHPSCNFRSSHQALLPSHRKTHETDPTFRYPFSCKFAGCDFRTLVRSCATNVTGRLELPVKS